MLASKNYNTHKTQPFIESANQRSTKQNKMLQIQQPKEGPPSRGLPNTVSPNLLMPCRQASQMRMGTFEEGKLPRSSRFLTLLELSAPKSNIPVDYYQNGGLPNCALDFLYEVPRISNLLD